MKHPLQEPAFDENGPYIRALCDVVVAALILDTPEAAATLGIMSRFGYRIDSHNGGTDAGCIICHTPTCKYDFAPHELTEKESCPRVADADNHIRMRGNKSELKREGELHRFQRIAACVRFGTEYCCDECISCSHCRDRSQPGKRRHVSELRHIQG